MSVKVMLVDDHKIFTEGLNFLLETYGIEVIGIAQNGFEAVEKATELRPEVILMDIKMPGCSGIEALQRIKLKIPDIKVIMLTTSDEDDDLFDAMRFGASGYLLKSLNGQELTDMIGGLGKGEIPLTPKLAARLLSEFGQNETKTAGYEASLEAKTGLNNRQMQVLKAVASGATYKQAGETLGITERTVKYHMGTIVEQLHMRNKAQVLTFAAKMGWVDSKNK